MQSFEPVINLLVLMSALSVASERLSNVIKLRSWQLRHNVDRKERDRQIANRVLIVSILLATAVKADFFTIISRLDAPWSTLGWAGTRLGSPAQVIQTVAGTTLTGVCLGFGSKFWHDVLDIVYATRRSMRTSPIDNRRPTTDDR